MKFRKKPVVIEAVQWTGNNLKEIEEFTNLNDVLGWSSYDLVIKTFEGDMNASISDWIIKGINGEFYPCKPEIFEKTYEEIK